MTRHQEGDFDTLVFIPLLNYDSKQFVEIIFDEFQIKKLKTLLTESFKCFKRYGIYHILQWFIHRLKVAASSQTRTLVCTQVHVLFLVQSRIVRGSLVLHQSVDVMLGPVLRGGHLKHVGHAEQRLPRVSVGDHLQTQIVDHNR